jgi:hypothetical protein
MNIRDYIHRLVDDYKERGSRGGGGGPDPIAHVSDPRPGIFIGDTSLMNVTTYIHR